MSAKKNKKSPPRHPRLEDVKSVRLGEALVKIIDEQRGTVGYSEFVRSVLEKALLTHRERLLADCENYLKVNGVTPEELIERRTKQP